MNGFIRSYGGHFIAIAAKTNDKKLRYGKSDKNGQKIDKIGRIGKTGIFPKNRASSLLSIYSPLSSCVTEGRTNGRTNGRTANPRNPRKNSLHPRKFIPLYDDNKMVST